MTAKRVRKFVLAQPEGDKAVLLEGLDEAFVGVYHDILLLAGPITKAVYSRQKLVKILMKRDGMEENDAREFIDYNIECLHGTYSPMLVDTP